jgi:hypothetical protein
MQPTGYKSIWQAGLLLAVCIWLTGCNLPVTPRGGGPTGSPPLPPEAGPTITPATYGVTLTYPCPQATQELPPRVTR